jgi:hypothetical protein
MPIFDTAEYLFKKSLGIVNSKVGTNYVAEAAGVARPKVIASLQVMNQDIPTTAPTNLASATITASKGPVTKQVSTAYPYLAKYTATLQDVITPYTSYRYDNPAAGLNLLTNSIPSNYDPAGGYGITLTTTDGGSPIIAANDSNYPWVFDTDAGYLYFTLNTFPSGYGSPVITFWRYEGTFGAGGGSGSANTIAQQFTN